jgi:hypothetical protein
MHRFSKAACGLALAGSLLSASADASQRAFVASTGFDTNTASNCPLTAPCRTFGAALTVVDAGGEVVALDGAGFGAVNITKSVTITANPGFYAGISAPTGSAVFINTAGVVVTLRGLNLNGVGGVNGIFMGNGARLSVENCVISNFTGSGINVNTAATVRISDTNIRDNGTTGLFLQSGSITTITRALISGSNHGVFVYSTVAGTTTVADVADSTISGNSLNGLLAYVDGVNAEILASIRDSRIVQNQTGVGANGGTAGGTTIFAVTNNLITNSVTGIQVFATGGKVWATGNTISYNDTGINNSTGVVESAGDNAIRNNGVATVGGITVIAKQ